MKIRLCTIGKTQFLFHPATLIFAAYMAFCGKAALFVVAMASVLLHECAHGMASWVMGEHPAAIEITPLGAVMRLDDEARLSPVRRLVMLLAGPCMTLCLCILSFKLTQQGLLTQETGRLLFMANAGILLLNLLPCLPLDGGRVVSLALDGLLGSVRTRFIMRVISVVIGIICIILSLWVTWRTGKGQFTLAACGCVILYAARVSTTTTAMAELEQWIARKIRMEQRGIMPVRVLAVMAETPLRCVISRLPHCAWTEIRVLEKGTMNTLISCNESTFIETYMKTPGLTCEALRYQEKA